MKPHTILSTLLLTAAAHAGRGSADYTITTETIDFGGQLVSSADYAIQGSIAPVTDISENNSPTQTITRHGYIGQLYDRLGLGMLASDFYPPEQGSTQITAVHTNDDGTNDPIPGDDVAWSILSGPVTGISPSGLAGTGAVHESTEATIGALVFGTPLQLAIYVQDTLPDNFGSYAGDGLPDAWQRLYFGLDNPLAAPLLDPDGDGQNNRFEFTAGINPTDPLSRFLLSIHSVPNEPTHKELRFSPVFSDRSYTVKSNTSLTGAWQDLTDQTDDHADPERTVIDRAASEPGKFYQVEIIKP